jgi:hypothetical protein
MKKLFGILLLALSVAFASAATSFNMLTDSQVNLTPLWSGSVNVLQYGAKGNGTTDDTLALRAAIAAAGNDRALIFPPGKTFILSGSLTPLQGQTWYCYGAKLKRADQVSVATATAITIGGPTRTVTVASTNGFYVGMDVTVFNGANYDPSSHRISAMTATTITMGTDFTVAFASGGTVVSSFSQISMGTSAPRVRIFGGEWDGNKANNTLLQKWDLNKEIQIASDGGVIRDVYVHDAQSEGIYLGGVNVIIDHARVEDCQGNGIHLSACEHPLVQNSKVKNCNLSGTATGHSDGCIIASNTVGDAKIVDCWVENGISGVGSFDSTDNSRMLVTGTTFTNFVTYAFEGSLPDGLDVSELILAKNKFYNAGSLYFSNNGSDSTSASGTKNIILSENILSDTKIIATLARGMLMSGNIITNSTTTAVVVQITDCRDLLATANQITGGGYGFYMQSANLPSGSTNNINVAINNNVLRNQQTAGIRFQTAGSLNCSAKNNTIIAQTGLVGASWDGILVKEDCTVEGNQIYAEAGANGINMSPSTTGGYARAIRNTITVASSMASIKTAGGSTKNIILQNLVSKAITDSGAPGNLVADNQTIGEIPVTLKRIVVDKISNYTITTNECGTVFGVNGAAGNITFTLPASPFIGLHYTFVTDNSTLRNIIVQTGTTVLIRQGASVTTATTGTITMSTNYQTMRVVCVSATLWVVEFLNTGTVTFA